LHLLFVVISVLRTVMVKDFQVSDRFLALTASPLAPGVSPVRIHYRDIGAGPPLVVLHGGWGYDVYPFDRQIAALAGNRRFVIPDRSGYGGSGRLSAQQPDFHHRAAGETFAVMDALGLDPPVLWGHSDGAVIALLMGLAMPGRIAGLIVEATHLYRDKPGSRAFFETMRDDPDGLGARVTAVLEREHGAAWRHLISINGAAWLRLADPPRAGDAARDLYDGRLRDLRVPTLVIHGARDPRTEPGELDALREALAPAGAVFEVLAGAGHSPHSERAAHEAATQAAARFLAALDAPARPAPTPRRAAP
jgi:pimeloyl-ACP methyl ester carboxylesterase